MVVLAGSSGKKFTIDIRYGKVEYCAAAALYISVVRSKGKVGRGDVKNSEGKARLCTVTPWHGAVLLSRAKARSSTVGQWRS